MLRAHERQPGRATTCTGSVWTLPCPSMAHKHSVAMARTGEIYPHARSGRTSTCGACAGAKWGENVGSTDGRPRGLQDAFMDSPVHRSNILDRRFDKVAVGVGAA